MLEDRAQIAATLDTLLALCDIWLLQSQPVRQLPMFADESNAARQNTIALARTHHAEPEKRIATDRLFPICLPIQAEVALQTTRESEVRTGHA